MNNLDATSTLALVSIDGDGNRRIRAANIGDLKRFAGDLVRSDGGQRGAFGGPQQLGPGPARGASDAQVMAPDTHLISSYGQGWQPKPFGYEDTMQGNPSRGFPPNDFSCPAGYNPAMTPESFLGGGCRNPNWVCDRGRALPPWLSTSDPTVVAAIINDYNAVGTVGQMRAVFEQLYALGEFSQNRYTAVVAGQTATSTVPNTDNFVVLGVRVDWGVDLLNWQPFDLVLATNGFQTLFNRQSVDRSFTVRVSRNNGSSIYVPLAQRTVGISFAQPTLGQVNAATGATITASNIPATVAAAFGMTVQLLTAFHPITAAYGMALGLLDGGAE